MKNTSLGRRLPFTAIAATAVLALTAAPARADMLSGGLLGSLLSGEEFTGPRVIDFLVIGLVVYLLFGLLTRRRDEKQKGAEGYLPKPGQTGKPAQSDMPQTPAETPAQPRMGQDKPPEPSGAKSHSQVNAYRAAEAAWDRLRSTPAQPPHEGQSSIPGQGRQAPIAEPQGEDEFLAGAKAAYARIRQSLDKGDLEDVRHFTEPAFFEILSKNQADKPHPGDLTILLIEASQVGQKTVGSYASIDVAFNAQVKRAAAGAKDIRLKETWTFIRNAADPDAMWRLSNVKDG
jgi:predicted lipid-binding transport protein (Tim44 family)